MTYDQPRSWRERMSTLLRDTAARFPGGRRLKTELDRWRRRSERTTARLDALRNRLTAAEPDETVLEAIMPLRYAARLVADDAPRARREAVFASRSASYRDAIANNPLPDTEEAWIGGLSWRVPRSASPAEGVTHQLLVRRSLPLREILKGRELAVGGVMLDIGANIGTTAIPRVVLGDFDHIYAAEPDRDNYACLVDNIVMNGLRGLVLPDRVAIGDTDGEMVLQRFQTGTHHLSVEPLEADAEAETVTCLRLDAWVQQLGIDLAEVTFVKCDTQGWDIRVIAGAPQVLAQRHIAWQIEFSPSMIRRSGYGYDEACAVLATHFTHFIDLRAKTGPRVRQTADIAESLGYLQERRRSYTNLLLYHAAR